MLYYFYTIKISAFLMKVHKNPENIAFVARTYFLCISRDCGPQTRRAI